MTFQPITDYHSYNHVLQAGAHWTHPTSGYTYACACEQKSGARQNLSVYRMQQGGAAWEHVKTYYGTIDAEGHITMGAASIEPNGDMLVTTSLTINGAEKVTGTGFQGCWVREPGIDEPYLTQDELLARLTQDTALLARIAALEAYFPLPGTLRLGPQNSSGAGGEIQLSDGKGGVLSIDGTNGELRIFQNGAAGKVTLRLTP